MHSHDLGYPTGLVCLASMTTMRETAAAARAVVQTQTQADSSRVNKTKTKTYPGASDHLRAFSCSQKTSKQSNTPKNCTPEKENARKEEGKVRTILPALQSSPTNLRISPHSHF